MKKFLVIIFFLFSFKSFSQQNEIITFFNIVQNIHKFNEMILDSSIVKFTDKWLYTPYKYGGDSINGIDCSHLNLKFLKEVFFINMIGSCQEQWNRYSKISRGKLEPGDLVFFKSNSSPSGWHCGAYIGDGQFIHASNHRDGVKISTLKSTSYQMKYKGAVRVKI